MKNAKTKMRACLRAFICFLFLNSCSSGTDKNAAEGVQTKGKPVMHTIEMSQMKFNPTELTVKKGDSIVFVNHDIVAHDVTEASTKAWNSSPMREGQSWTFVATASVDYYCSIHPLMKGKIVVQ